MYVIDKTPFRDRQGGLSVVARAQGALKYGMEWPAELDAQSKVIAQLDRALDKGFVLIRNFTLPDSDILIPLVLVGPGSIAVILASPLKGQFEARGAEWNELKNGVATPAKRNLMDYVSKLSRAFQKYLQMNEIQAPVPVEAALIFTDPGAQIEAHQPILRVVRSDAVRQYANHLNQINPVLRAEDITKLADRIVMPELQSPSAPEKETGTPPPRPTAMAQPPAAARPAANHAPAMPRPSAPPEPAPRKTKPPISRTQIILLAALGLFECCLLAGGGVLLFYFSQ